MTNHQKDLLLAEVSSTVDAMGYVDESDGNYVVNSDTCECLRELLRHLRNDDIRHGFIVLRHLGELNIVEQDLIPMVKLNLINEDRAEYEKLHEFLIRILVTLTYPAFIHFKEKRPTDAVEEQIYLTLNQHLRTYKIAFARDVKFWRVASDEMRRIMSLDYSDITDTDLVYLERILVLLRNIVHVGKDELILSHTALEDEDIHDDMITTLMDGGMMEIIVKMCAEPDFHQFAFHCLEVLSHLFKEQNATYLATDDVQVDVNTGIKTSNRGSELLELQRVEREQRKINSCPYNRFKGASYVVKNLKSISSKDMIIHKTVENPLQIDLNQGKQAARRPKNRRPMKGDNTFKSSRLGINYRTPFGRAKASLKNFCSMFIAECYNPIMNYVKNCLEHNHAQENDETFYFWAAAFFMEYNRVSKANSKFVEETISTDYLHYVHTILTHHVDMINNEKTEVKTWFRRLHVALRAYKELVMTIGTLKSDADEYVIEQAIAIRHRLLYDMDYRELLLYLINNFNEMKMSEIYLKDLIETNHVFLKMLEALCKKDTEIIIKTKKRWSRRKKKTEKPEKAGKAGEENDGSAELIWSEIVGEVTAAVEGKIPLPQPEDDPEVVPYSPLSEKSRDEQKEEVMFRIHRLLRCRKAASAVSLYRHAREAYVEDGDNAFGLIDNPTEDDVLALHEIIAIDLWPGMDKELDKEMLEKANENQDDQENQENIDPERDESEPEENFKETKFDFPYFVQKYASSKTVKALVRCLKTFRTNSTQFNHSIVKLCHRISWDCKQPVFFFQLSLFQIFKKCYETPASDKRYAELKSFAKYIISAFAKMAAGNNKLLIELLFWKTRKEVAEIEGNYVQAEKVPKESRRKKGPKSKSKDLVSDSEDEDKIDGNEDKTLKENGKNDSMTDPEKEDEQPNNLDAINNDVDELDEIEKMYADLNRDDDALSDYDDFPSSQVLDKLHSTLIDAELTSQGSPKIFPGDETVASRIRFESDSEDDKPISNGSGSKKNRSRTVLEDDDDELSNEAKMDASKAGEGSGTIIERVIDEDISEVVQSNRNNSPEVPPISEVSTGQIDSDADDDDQPFVSRKRKRQVFDDDDDD
ncbi:circadian regulator timeout [Brevipalpus obovatus]|uniref:circadian regulator timeout n=1 Tax=Brevipalpus obovatus TaxID=246614 RepID=UPI003D9F3734